MDKFKPQHRTEHRRRGRHSLTNNQIAVWLRRFGLGGIVLAFLVFQAACASPSQQPVQQSAALTAPPQQLPFFPLGLYYVDYDLALENANTLDGQLEAIQSIADAGFNTIHFAIYDDLDETATALKKAEALGLHVIADYQSDLSRAEVVNQLKDSPAIVGWNIGDDVNENFEPHELDALNREMGLLDGNRPTYISMFDPDPKVIQRYVGSADWIGMQSYPVGERNLNATFDEIRTVVDAARSSGGAPVIANLQAFQWEQKFPFMTTRPPQFAELRNMTFQALAAGAQGILYYTYRDPDWYLPEQGELWEQMSSTLVPEIEAIAPWLQSGNRKTFQVNQHVIAATWTLNNAHLLMVINTHDQDEPVDFNLSTLLPEVSLDKLKAVNERVTKPSTPLTITSDQKISGTLTPLSTQLYQISPEIY